MKAKMTADRMIVLQALVQTLREQVKLLRSHRQRAVVLAHLSPLRPEAQAHPKAAPAKCAALETARRLQLEPAQTPKVANCTSFPAIPSSHLACLLTRACTHCSYSITMS